MLKVIPTLLFYLFIAAMATVPTSGGAEQIAGLADVYTHKNNIPPRLQWNQNSGYCGEVSLISAGLYYGQYISQYEARAITSKNSKQNKSQLLLGVNDEHAASQMRLNFVEWSADTKRNTDQFLAWVKQYVVKGHPVAIGIYTNEYLFYEKTNPNAGDSVYDHIVPVTGIGSDHPLTDPHYYSDDIIYFSDNGLWAPSGNPPYNFSYFFSAFQADRHEANAKNGSIYSLANNKKNYGIAITGVMDKNGDTLPIRINTNINYEKPEIKEGSNQRPKPCPIILTITVSNLEQGISYNLYRYNNLDCVPTSNFNTHANQASESWKIQSGQNNTFIMTQEICSDEIAIYRAVKSTAR